MTEANHSCGYEHVGPEDDPSAPCIMSGDTAVLFTTPSERRGTMDLFEFQGALRYATVL